jgi:hypothetical protein
VHVLYNTKTGETLEPLRYRNGLPLCHDPLYGAEALGNRCYDELDHDDCEDGFIDRGFGCEPENKDGPVPQICPPTCPNDEDLPPIDDGNEGVIPEDPEDKGNGNGNGNGDDNDNDNGNEDSGDDFFNRGNNGSFFE